jgi:predicted nucleotidyltransferase component of viral defense system
MLSKPDLQRLANRQKVALGTLEKDYVLTEVLKALAQVPALSHIFIFKGGTALRKAYFSDWRYSEDLDFTVKRDFTREELRQALETWYRHVVEESQIQLTTRQLHKPDGYAQVRIQYLGPLAYPGMIYMDLSFDELLCLQPELRRLLTAPFVAEPRNILVYPLEELLAEKLRSLIERGKSRDYYDVWRLLKEHPSQLDFKLLGTILPGKLAHKGISLKSVIDFLPGDSKAVKRYWEEDLGQQISPLPPLAEVLEQLRELLDEFIAPHITPTSE